MNLSDTPILCHEALSGGYMMLRLDAPDIVRDAKPGQFVHLRIPNIEPSALRRPFSICNAEDGVLSILYKKVGRGTEAMARLRVGDTVNLMGPIGNGFPMPAAGVTPLLVAGGFGVAPLLFLAKRCKTKGVMFVGGRTAADILLVEEFEKIGWEAQICTNDGSRCTQGFVTTALDAWLEKNVGEDSATPAELFACGPEPMLEAVDMRAQKRNMRAWISLDRRMGCGVGACLGCVQKIRRVGTNGEVEIYRARVCKDGPVFADGTIVWGEQ